MRPIDIVRTVCPRAKASYLAAIEHGDDLFATYGISTPLRMAHFLAQICHESGGMTIDWESGNYSAERLVEIFGVGHHSAAITSGEAETLAHNGQAIFNRVYGDGNPKKARELGNVQPGDGWRYRGGGLMQTTGRANYQRMGKKCGVDFEAHPELVLSADHALKPALAEWSDGHLNDAADRDDILTITKRINGGTNGLAERRLWLAKLKPLCADLEIRQAPTAPPLKPVIPPPPDIPKPLPPKPPSKAPAATASGLFAIIAAFFSQTQTGPYMTLLLMLAAFAGGYTASIFTWEKVHSWLLKVQDKFRGL